MPMHGSKKFGFLYLAIFILIFIGVPLVLGGRKGQRMEKKVAEWPSVKGEVVKIDKKIISPYSPDLRYKSEKEVVRIVYSYNVAGLTYRNDVVYPGGNGYVDKDFENKYPINAIVLVYYNTDSPSESCLQKLRPFSMSKTIVVGWLLIVSSLVLLSVRGLLFFLHK